MGLVVFCVLWWCVGCDSVGRRGGHDDGKKQNEASSLRRDVEARRLTLSYHHTLHTHRDERRL